MKSEVDVLVVGAGAAGIGAALALETAGADYLVVEARSRPGGRAWTVDRHYPLDLGCGWLHSADRNPWTDIATAQGRLIDKTPPPWTRPSAPIGFSLEDQRAFGHEIGAFFDRLDSARSDPDRPASSLLDPGGRWNRLLDAVSTYINGAELEYISVIDFARYEDTEVNWRVVEGYGAVVSVAASPLRIVFDCPASTIDHSGPDVRVMTPKGAIASRTVIVTVPSAHIALGRPAFVPDLPDKRDAAAHLPLGLADKLFLSLSGAEEFEQDSRLFGRTDDAGTGAYHVRPFGRPMIEAYFGGKLADELERDGAEALADFAIAELVSLLGSNFARRIQPVACTQWRNDPLALGSYSYARPGASSCRETIAAAVDGRLFFAGEACSPNLFSTAQGAYLTGRDAAAQALASLSRAGPRQSASSTLRTE